MISVRARGESTRVELWIRPEACPAKPRITTPAVRSEASPKEDFQVMLYSSDTPNRGQHGRKLKKLDLANRT